MRVVTNGYRGLHLLVKLNADRLLWPAAIFAALWAGGSVPGL